MLLKEKENEKWVRWVVNQEVWVDVLVHGGGAARVPVNTCELIDPIVPFDNYHYNEHFAERDAIEAS